MSDQVEIPEGMDVGIYLQGLRAKQSGAPDDNPFNPDFAHQFESWAAGYAAGQAPEVPAPEEEAEATSSRRKGRQKDSDE